MTCENCLVFIPNTCEWGDDGYAVRSEEGKCTIDFPIEIPVNASDPACALKITVRTE